MSHRFTRLRYHLVFSTKERQPLLQGDLGSSMHAYLGGIARNLGGTALEIGGVADHVHLLVELPPTLCIADAMMKLKANSSKWMNESRGPKQRFSWQQGYSAFTVSESTVDATIAYIRAQPSHHAKHSFVDELKAFLAKNGLTLDDDDLL